jgi:hypothetical protein
LLGIPLLAERVGVFTAFSWWFDCTGKFIHQLGHIL